MIRGLRTSQNIRNVLNSRLTTKSNCHFTKNVNKLCGKTEILSILLVKEDGGHEFTCT